MPCIIHQAINTRKYVGKNVMTILYIILTYFQNDFEVNQKIIILYIRTCVTIRILNIDIKRNHIKLFKSKIFN